MRAYTAQHWVNEELHEIGGNGREAFLYDVVPVLVLDALQSALLQLHDNVCLQQHDRSAGSPPPPVDCSHEQLLLVIGAESGVWLQWLNPPPPRENIYIRLVAHFMPLS